MSIKQEELKDYLFNLPPSYRKSAIPNVVETEIDQSNREFREIIWDLILSGDPLSLCGLNSKGLLIKKENGETCQVKDSKLFISSIFFIINECYFELMPFIYKFKIMEKVSEFSRLYDFFDETLYRSAKTADHKSTKRKRKLPEEPTRQKFREDLRSSIDNLTKFLKETPLQETRMWNEDKKINEKILIKQLYDCFKRSCDISKEDKDIFFNIAKVTLIFGNDKRAAQVRNYEPVINHSFISAEMGRVEKIYSRLNLSIKK